MGGLCANSLELTGPAGDPESPVHRRDPRAKLLAFGGVTLVGVSASVTSAWAWAACALALAALAALARVPASVVFRRARVVLPLVLFVAVFVPFLREGGREWSLGPLTVSETGLAVLAGVAAKATIGTVSAVLLGATTAFPQVVRALDALRVPRLFTLIAALTYRYLFVVVEEVGRMRAALTARGHRPRHLLQVGPSGRIAAALFLRTHARGERVHLAMVARGWSGSMPQLEPLRFARADVVLLVLVALALLPARVLA